MVNYLYMWDDRQRIKMLCSPTSNGTPGHFMSLWRKKKIQTCPWRRPHRKLVQRRSWIWGRRTWILVSLQTPPLSLEVLLRHDLILLIPITTLNTSPASSVSLYWLRFTNNITKTPLICKTPCCTKMHGEVSNRVRWHHTVSYMKIWTQTAEGLKTDLVKQSGQYLSCLNNSNTIIISKDVSRIESLWLRVVFISVLCCQFCVHTYKDRSHVCPHTSPA